MSLIELLVLEDRVLSTVSWVNLAHFSRLKKIIPTTVLIQKRVFRMQAEISTNEPQTIWVLSTFHIFFTWPGKI